MTVMAMKGKLLRVLISTALKLTDSKSLHVVVDEVEYMEHGGPSPDMTKVLDALRQSARQTDVRLADVILKLIDELKSIVTGERG